MGHELVLSQEIIKGVAIGVGGGVTTAGLLGLWRGFVKYRDRREQISYIRSLIADHRQKIIAVYEATNTTPEEGLTDIDVIRFARFQTLQSDLRTALSSRSTALTYKDKFPLHRFLADSERAATSLGLSAMIPFEIVQALFDDLESAGWVLAM